MLFTYKAAAVGMSHIDDAIMHVYIQLPALTGFAMILCGAINVHKYMIYKIIDTIMYALSFGMCLVPLFTDNTRIITIAKCAASAIQMLVFVFIALIICKYNMRDDGYSENGKVVVQQTSDTIHEHRYNNQ